MTATGSADRAIVLHAQAANETGSNLSHDSVPTILDAPGIAKGADHKAIASAEAIASVNLPRLDNGKLSALTLRGVSPDELLQLRPEMHMVQGRMFRSGAARGHRRQVGRRALRKSGLEHCGEVRRQ